MTPHTLFARPDAALQARAAAPARVEIEDHIEKLIAVLDMLDADPDLEPWLGSGDDREDENEHGGDIVDEPHDDRDEGNDEPWLGRLETLHQGGGTYAGLCPLTDAAYWQPSAPPPMVELKGAGIPVFRVSYAR